MNGSKILKGIGFTFLAAAIILGVTWGVMTLWNWLMPDLFGLTTITFWQSMGLLVLVKTLGWIFTGGSRKRSGWGHPRRHQWKRKFHEKWQNMSEEERKAFKAKAKGRCGSWRFEDYENPATETPEDGSVSPA